ncbi:MAG: response regulator [Phycisphaerales bacterium]|nr:MAG: response regulator [Phycisphaerales bacterium]
MNAAEHPTKKEVMGGTLRRKPVLLVESDFQHTLTISRIFRELRLLDDLAISVDCESALMRLNQTGGGRPRLVLLDLKMPRMSALSFLRLLKEDANLQTIPVVILADSNHDDDVSTCYNLGAAGYLVKSGDYRELRAKLKGVCTYWTLSRVPKS